MRFIHWLGRKTRDKRWVGGVVLSVLAVVLGRWLVGPPPPRKIILATGQPVGMYTYLGHQYRQRLSQAGLKVEVLPSNGSIDNLQHLLAGRADVAFVQGGTYPLVKDDQGLRGLASVGRQPLWVLCRGNEPAGSLADLKERTIILGPIRSGTAALAQLLLQAHGIDTDKTRLRHEDISNIPFRLSPTAA